MRRGCEQHGIALSYRPPGRPHFGGIVERVIGTAMQWVHELPGTTFSSPAECGAYGADGTAALTLRELEPWLTLAVAAYHGSVHGTLLQREGDTLALWKLDRLRRDLLHLVNTVHDFTARGIGLKVLTAPGAAIDTTTPAGKLVCGIFAALSEFERALISERTVAGLASARARGRKGGRPFKMTPAKLRLAMAAMGQPETQVGKLCEGLGVTRQTLYRHVSPKGELRPDRIKLLSGGRPDRGQ